MHSVIRFSLLYFHLFYFCLALDNYSFVEMANNGLPDTVQNLCGTTSCEPVRCWKWDVSQITATQSRRQDQYAVLVLNRPITQTHHFIMQFWNNASVRLTVDGGMVQWDKYISKLPDEARKNIKLPELITGDFDSVTEDILEKYKKKGCKAINTPNQDLTDFTKALVELSKYCREHKTEVQSVIAIGQSSGRIDQILGNIQTLFLAKEKRLLPSNMQLYLMSDDAISWLLYPGDHVITIPETTRKHKRSWCSLVPVGETCQMVTTSGLKWNLDKQSLKFGELVSTSNTFDGSDKVIVKCSSPILWSMRIPNLFGA